MDKEFLKSIGIILTDELIKEIEISFDYSCKQHKENNTDHFDEFGKNKTNTMYGKNHTEETLKLFSQKRIEYLETHNHPRLGMHNKEETNRKISEKAKGRKNPLHSEWMKLNNPSTNPDVAKKISEANKGKRTGPCGPNLKNRVPKKKFECSRCHKIVGGESNLYRWHEENCKYANAR